MYAHSSAERQTSQQVGNHGRRFSVLQNKFFNVFKLMSGFKFDSFISANIFSVTVVLLHHCCIHDCNAKFDPLSVFLSWHCSSAPRIFFPLSLLFAHTPCIYALVCVCIICRLGVALHRSSKGVCVMAASLHGVSAFLLCSSRHS